MELCLGWCLTVKEKGRTLDLLGSCKIVRSEKAGSTIYRMGIVLLIFAVFYILGGVHTAAFLALFCAVLFVLFVSPAMAIGKLFRV